MVYPSLPSILEQACGLDKTRPIVAGVSGGPDSLTLLDVLTTSGYRVIAAHFDHHLRKESGADAEVVRQAAEKYGCEFTLGEGDVAALARGEKLSIEEAARKARYRFLFDTARRTGAQAVAVGHNADDQVETILMHLLRGSGLAGLRGMPWRGVVPEFDPALALVRPLLGMWRVEILAYCKEHDLHPLTDASNADTTYYRNKLRLELLPYLHAYNPRVKEVLWRMGQALQGDYEIVEAASRDARRAMRMERREGSVRWERDVFLNQSLGVRRSLLRGMIAALRENERDLDFETVERGLGFIEKPTRSGEIELALSLNLVVEGGRVFLKEKTADLTDPAWPRLDQESVDLLLPGAVMLADRWSLRAEVMPRPPEWREEIAVPDKMTSWLDRDKLPAALLVRRQRPGDRLRPFGFDGHSIKVSDVWVNTKLPRPARKDWPLVCAGQNGERIVWLPGYRPAQDFAVDEKTRQVVRLALKKES